MFDAIVTKYHGPTATKPSRVSATRWGQKTVYVPYRSGETTYQNHLRAATILMDQINTKGKWIAGFGGGSDCVFVLSVGGGIDHIYETK